MMLLDIKGKMTVLMAPKSFFAFYLGQATASFEFPTKISCFPQKKSAKQWRQSQKLFLSKDQILRILYYSC